MLNIDMTLALHHLSTFLYERMLTSRNAVTGVQVDKDVFLQNNDNGFRQKRRSSLSGTVDGDANVRVAWLAKVSFTKEVVNTDM